MGEHDRSQCWRCSFCGKSDLEVCTMISGPTVNICDECVELCNKILEEPRGGKPCRCGKHGLGLGRADAACAAADAKPVVSSAGEA